MRTIKTAFKTLCLSIFIGIMPVGLAHAFSGPGAGTSDNPFLVGSCAQLQNMNADLTATYKIIRNIDCTGVGFTPVGDSSTPFTGTLNGGGYNIENLTINEIHSDDVGLLGETGTGATITDLSMSAAIVNGDNQVGTLVGNAENSDISSIRIHNTDVTASGDNVGGMVGELGGSGLSASDTTSAFVNGDSEVGGLVGWAVGGAAVTDSFTLASVDATSVAGVLIGQVGNGPTIVDNTYADGQVSGTSDEIGGLIGLYAGLSGSSVSDSFTVATILDGGNPTGAVFGAVTGTAVTGNLWFDKNAAGSYNCTGIGGASGCTAVDTDGSDPDHFVDTTSVEPLSGWDFTNTWAQNHSGLPTLGALFNWGPTGSPNNNDANGDGIDDSFQPNVNSVPSDTDVWSTIAVPSSSGCDVQNPEWARPVNADTGYTHAFQTMTAFTLYCNQVGETVPVTIIYDKKYDTTDWVLRYYNENTKQYSTVSGAIFGTKTVGGVVKTTVTYDIKDGGSLDSDEATNGIIVDPVVPALSLFSSTPLSTDLTSISAPDTGDGQPRTTSKLSMSALSGSIILISVGLVLAFRRKTITQQEE